MFLLLGSVSSHSPHKEYRRLLSPTNFRNRKGREEMIKAFPEELKGDEPEVLPV
jgi:hypothetical protein